MSYYDHLCVALSREDALALFPHLVATDENDNATWAVSVFEGGSAEGLDLITAEAEWDHSDPENLVLTKPQDQFSGFWFIVSLPAQDAAIEADPACKLIASRALHEAGAEGGFLTYLDPAFEADFITVLRFSPQIAGTAYPDHALP